MGASWGYERCFFDQEALNHALIRIAGVSFVTAVYA